MTFHQQIPHTSPVSPTPKAAGCRCATAAATAVTSSEAPGTASTNAASDKQKKGHVDTSGVGAVVGRI